VSISVSDPPTVDLRSLRYFVAVAEELHFGRAARRLNISQPPLSQQIRQLETALDVALFVRTSRRVELTPAGTALLDGARRIIAETSRVVAATRRAGRGEVDMLRIGFTDSAALGVLPELVRAYHAEYPDVHLDLTEGTTEAQLDAVEHDLVDLAIVRGPVADGRWRTVVVQREPFVVALPHDHVLAQRRILSVAALSGETFVLFPRHLASPFYDLIVSICRREGFEPQVRYQSAEYETILSLVAAGLGIAIVPSSVRNLQRAGVEFRRLRNVADTAELTLVYRPHRHSAALERFVQVASGVGAGESGSPRARPARGRRRRHSPHLD
jgi:DNA-binding transcriptional LysR family regulator